MATASTAPVSLRVHGPKVSDRVAFERMREECRSDPGAFHGAIAKRQICWLVKCEGGPDCWVYYDQAAESWTGWDAQTGAPVTPDWQESFEPWDRAFNDDDPPNWRWFEGGLTSVAFNEVDRHVLAGHGEEAALIFEGDRWNMASDGGRGGPVDSETVSRRKLLLESAKCALALKALGLKPGDRIALNMPSIPEQIYWTEGAKRLGIVYTPVFGGFSDKTLSDRIADAGARVVITADGSYRNAQMVPFKPNYTDPALDNFIAVPVAMELLGGALSDVSPEHATLIRDTVAELLEGEVTVERSDVMRGVGKALRPGRGVAADPASVLRRLPAAAGILRDAGAVPLRRASGPGIGPRPLCDVDLPRG